MRLARMATEDEVGQGRIQRMGLARDTFILEI